jgi:hypothetical protein
MPFVFVFLSCPDKRDRSFLHFRLLVVDRKIGRGEWIRNDTNLPLPITFRLHRVAEKDRFWLESILRIENIR